MHIRIFSLLIVLLSIAGQVEAQWIDDGAGKIRTNKFASVVPIGENTGVWHPNTAYRLSIDGSFIVTEMRVRPRGQWPDYVFLPDYQLRPLQEVDAYTRAHHHLPGLPSTEEVATGELSLGEAQRLLTEKIEELTLYLIQSHDRKKALLEELEQLEAQLDGGTNSLMPKSE